MDRLTCVCVPDLYGPSFPTSEMNGQPNEDWHEYEVDDPFSHHHSHRTDT